MMHGYGWLCWCRLNCAAVPVSVSVAKIGAVMDIQLKQQVVRAGESVRSCSGLSGGEKEDVRLWVSEILEVRHGR